MLLSLPTNILLDILALIEGRQLVHLYSSSRFLYHKVTENAHRLRKFSGIDLWLITRGEEQIDYFWFSDKPDRWLKKEAFKVPKDVDAGENSDLEIGGELFRFSKLKMEGTDQLTAVFRLEKSIDEQSTNIEFLLQNLLLHYAPSALRSNVPNQLLAQVARLFTDLRWLTYEPAASTEEAILQALDPLSKLQEFRLTLPHQVSLNFFNHQAIKRLDHFAFHCTDQEAMPAFNDETLLGQAWHSCNFETSKVTAEGANHLLKQWANGEREIEFVDIHLDKSKDAKYGDIIGDIPAVIQAGKRFAKSCRAKLMRKDKRTMHLFFFTAQKQRLVLAAVTPEASSNTSFD